MKFRIFILSVQGEFAGERRMLKDYIEHSPVLRRFFEVFIFEDAPPTDRLTDLIDACRAADLPDPVAEVGCNTYCITIFRPIDENTGSRDPVNDPVNGNTALLVLNAIRNHPGIRRNAIAQIVGVSEATVKHRLRELSSTVEFRGFRRQVDIMQREMKGG